MDSCTHFGIHGSEDLERNVDRQQCDAHEDSEALFQTPVHTISTAEYFPSRLRTAQPRLGVGREQLLQRWGRLAGAVRRCQKPIAWKATVMTMLITTVATNGAFCVSLIWYAMA